MPKRKKPMPEFTFVNVTITIAAPTAKAAYDRLCSVMEKGTRDDPQWLEFATDTFTAHQGRNQTEQSTSKLFPRLPR